MPADDVGIPRSLATGQEEKYIPSLWDCHGLKPSQ